MSKGTNNTFAISSVKYTDTDGNERQRIVVDIPEEHWDDFFETWRGWNERHKPKTNT